MTPEQRVGRIANLTIFLGILYSCLNLAALLGSVSMGARGFGLVGLLPALAVVGLGYGIRFGSLGSLYATTCLFILFAGYSLFQLIAVPDVLLFIRFALSALALYGLCRSVPAMHTLKATGSMPIQSSRYGDFFLRRGRNRKG